MFRRTCRVIDSGDSDVSWKLPAGGWVSNVSDLARFAVGMIGDELLDDETKAEMWTPAMLADGSETRYGLGWNLGEMAGARLVSHSGAQRKTRTLLLIAPERGMAVALMTNSEGTNLSGLGGACMTALLSGS